MVKWMSVIMKKIWFIIVFFTLIIQFEAKSDHSNVTFTSGAKVAYSSSDFIIFDVGKSAKIPQHDKVFRYFGNEASEYCSKHRKDTYLFYKWGAYGDYYDAGNLNKKFLHAGIRFFCANSYNKHDNCGFIILIEILKNLQLIFWLKFSTIY